MGRRDAELETMVGKPTIVAMRLGPAGFALHVLLDGELASQIQTVRPSGIVRTPSGS